MTDTDRQEPRWPVKDTAEGQRLEEADQGKRLWRLWGPYLSERQWGTVREDYSPDGNAWDYLPHDQARSRAYRWGEDGIGGFGDDSLHLCLSVAMWNGNDPILKERMFGLTNREGNHGEDVKECYYYLDATPTHSYLRMLYKYPQRAFPYDDLLRVNAERGLDRPEYELIDTGIFDESRYFDVEIEYAKAAPDDIVLAVTATNRGPERATLHLLPQLWARNIWSFMPTNGPRPLIKAEADGSVLIDHALQDDMRLTLEGAPSLLFCENDTNTRRLFGTDAPGTFKDGINDYLVYGRQDAVSRVSGTKMAAHYQLDLEPGAAATVRLRLRPDAAAEPSGGSMADVVKQRREEADAFYNALQRRIEDQDRRLVQRQALAGMIWSKQYYAYDIGEWLTGDPLQPTPPESRKHGRNSDWRHLVNADILSMPDKWEYPWYASWDLAFHCVTFALIDPAFAKSQLVLLTQARFMHPDGQLPAYEWNFEDANPPVHAWAALQIYQIDRRENGGKGDLLFLERVFHKLMLNFTWWVNRKDANQRNIFQGGFLGLDNIGLFDRSAPLPSGGRIDQSDGTAWVAMYALNLLRIALELALQNEVYQDLATKFFEHFLYIAGAATALGGTGTGLWDEEDQFYYDFLKVPDRPEMPLRVRSMVGLIPLFAVEVLHEEFSQDLPGFNSRREWFLKHRPDLAALVSYWTDKNEAEFSLLSLARGHRLKKVLRRMLDETEFLSDHGVRAVSKYHEAHPYSLTLDGQTFEVRYVPGEGQTRLFGGNSNWRGPVWMPVNYLIVDSLHKFFKYFGPEFVVEYPTGSGLFLSLEDIANRLTERLNRLFLRGLDGRRAVFGDCALLQNDPHFRDHILFHEYFHGETGRGLGAAHQTGWTGLVALLLHPREDMDPAHVTPAIPDHGQKDTASASLPTTAPDDGPAAAKTVSEAKSP